MKNMNESVLKAVAKVYEEVSIDEPDVLMDFENDFLTENTCRNGRDVVWYNDENESVAVYVDTLEVLTEEEIEEQLL